MNLVSGALSCSTSRLVSVALGTFCSDEEAMVGWVDKLVREGLREALRSLDRDVRG